jgi:penicillin-binding protein 1A
MPEGISTVLLGDVPEYHYSEFPPPEPYPPTVEFLYERPAANDTGEDPLYDLIRRRRPAQPEEPTYAPILERPFLN